MQSLNRLVHVDSLRTILLGQLFAICTQNQRRVQIQRLRQTQRALQQNLPRSVVRQVLAADYMRNALRSIIHHYCQLIRPQAVCTPEHKVANFQTDILRLMPQQAVSPVNAVCSYIRSCLRAIYLC